MEVKENPKTKLVGVDNPKVETKRILIFLAITFGFGWFVEIGMIMPMYRSQDVNTVKEATELISSMMFAPAIAALIARLCTKEGLLKSGLQFNFSQHKFCFLFSWFGTSVLTFLGALLYFLIYKDNYDPNFSINLNFKLSKDKDNDNDKEKDEDKDKEESLSHTL